MQEQKPASNVSTGASTGGTAGWGELFAGRNAIRALTLVGGVALHAINVFIATTILPTVVRDIGGMDYYAWNTALFVTASILGSALVPNLLSRTGPRHAYLLAAAIFAAGTLACGFAPSMPAMLAGRVVQGLGGGMMLALSYAMIRIVFDERLWPRAIALVSGMWGVATLVGPAVGGIFAELGVWRAAFWSLVPVIGLFALLATAILPLRAPGAGSTDRLAWRQLLLLTGSVLAVSAASISTQGILNVAGVAAALAMLVLLVRVERRSAKRIMPKGSFRLHRLGALYLTMGLLSASVTSSEVFVPLFFQVLHGQSPLVAGYLAAIMGASWTFGSIGSSGLMGRRADRIILAAPVMGIAGMGVLAILVPPGSTGQWQDLLPICLAMAVVGLGVGMTWPHLLTRIFKRAEPEDQNLASASITMVQLFTTAQGAALAGMAANLAGLSHPGGVAGASNAALWLFCSFALMSALALLSAIALVRRS
ncbi:MFS transporter [Falsochrobactrum shanghaiense]|uniref:MFS transporter n=1 Tax=Falsochrobactrum shanghaiense TaxID=2201899 RepID=A0A316JIV2_9HYPH|nr:MFS transporter [Falsochrobactrum shanghaiense]PWL19193.1 MFS transporter [Falsochrobactrum shanghaiense]